ncbi:MAG: SDR family NAD(P)-dependent oxidoreductase [Anaerolineae bacterium]|jgi:nucleoside-diphosphate-sugar epimerase|nr:SDR family NAD(P)-dependent oxidoreductase [Anaerolineae bacterium]
MQGLAGQTVLVTGATGFVGGALARRLAAAGVQVRALARRPERERFLRGVPGIEIVPGDITDAERMRQVVAGCTVVFHVAAALGGPLAVQQAVNVGGTQQVARAAAAAGVQRLVHVSSIAIYGFPAGGTVTEAFTPLPTRVPYNLSKREAEAALIDAAQDMPWSILRPGMIYGPGSAMWTGTLFRLAQRRPTPFIGAGDGRAPCIHIDDVVEMLGVLATHPAAVGAAFNCVNDPAPAWRDFLGAYARLAGHERWWALPVTPVKLLAPLAEALLWLRGEPQDVPRLVDFVTGQVHYAMDSARDRLGWQPQVSLAEGIQRCVPYLRAKGLLA